MSASSSSLKAAVKVDAAVAVEERVEDEEEDAMALIGLFWAKDFSTGRP